MVKAAPEEVKAERKKDEKDIGWGVSATSVIKDEKAKEEEAKKKAEEEAKKKAAEPATKKKEEVKKVEEKKEDKAEAIHAALDLKARIKIDSSKRSC